MHKAVVLGIIVQLLQGQAAFVLQQQQPQETPGLELQQEPQAVAMNDSIDLNQQPAPMQQFSQQGMLSQGVQQLQQPVFAFPQPTEPVDPTQTQGTMPIGANGPLQVPGQMGSASPSAQWQMDNQSSNFEIGLLPGAEEVDLASAPEANRSAIRFHFHHAEEIAAKLCRVHSIEHRMELCNRLGNIDHEIRRLNPQSRALESRKCLELRGYGPKKLQALRAMLPPDGCHICMIDRDLLHRHEGGAYNEVNERLGNYGGAVIRLDEYELRLLRLLSQKQEYLSILNSSVITEDMRVHLNRQLQRLEVKIHRAERRAALERQRVQIGNELRNPNINPATAAALQSQLQQIEAQIQQIEQQQQQITHSERRRRELIRHISEVSNMLQSPMLAPNMRSMLTMQVNEMRRKLTIVERQVALEQRRNALVNLLENHPEMSSIEKEALEMRIRTLSEEIQTVGQDQPLGTPYTARLSQLKQHRTELMNILQSGAISEIMRHELRENLRQIEWEIDIIHKQIRLYREEHEIRRMLENPSTPPQMRQALDTQLAQLEAESRRLEYKRRHPELVFQRQEFGANMENASGVPTMARNLNEREERILTELARIQGPDAIERQRFKRQELHEVREKILLHQEKLRELRNQRHELHKLIANAQTTNNQNELSQLQARMAVIQQNIEREKNILGHRKYWEEILRDSFGSQNAGGLPTDNLFNMARSNSFNGQNLNYSMNQNQPLNNGMNPNQNVNNGMNLNQNMNNGMNLNQNINNGMGSNQNMNNGMGSNQNMNNGMGPNQTLNNGMGSDQNLNDGMGSDQNMNDGMGSNQSMNNVMGSDQNLNDGMGSYQNLNNDMGSAQNMNPNQSMTCGTNPTQAVNNGLSSSQSLGSMEDGNQIRSMTGEQYGQQFSQGEDPQHRYHHHHQDGFDQGGLANTGF